MGVSFLTFNCRGLHGLEKRRDVLNFLKKKNKSIYFLQDTHFTNDDLTVIRAIWGFEVHISPGKSDSRGVAILFNNNFEYDIFKITPDEKGNFLSIEIKIENYIILLVNIYGPNCDSPEFFQSLHSSIDEFQGDFIIIGGDFNLVQDKEIDYYKYKHTGNPKAREVVLEMIEKLQLSDPWRLQHKNEKRYTWFGPSNKKGRLDFFLISSHLMNFLNNSTIDIGYRSDHSMVLFDIKFINFEKGKGFWKFNNSLLKDKIYIDGVKDILLSLKQQYALMPYLRDALKI